MTDSTETAGAIQSLGCLDPAVREDTLDRLWESIEEGIYSIDELQWMGSLLVEQLKIENGCVESDLVFRRTFSALILGVIVTNDELNLRRGCDSIPHEMISRWYSAAFAYVLEERDFRGFVPGKGWAHSISHSADLLRSFIFHSVTQKDDHLRILELLSQKILANTEEVFLNNDDHRLSRVVITALLRNCLSIEEYRNWVNGLLRDLPGDSWIAVSENRSESLVWFNARAFIQALYFTLSFRMKEQMDISFYKSDPILKEEMLEVLTVALRKLDSGLNYR